MKYEPQTLDELQTSINLHERLLREQPEQEASFPVMEEQFVVLGKACGSRIRRVTEKDDIYEAALCIWESNVFHD